MKYRKLRIAWSMAWGLVCVLLIALWMRSYWRYDSVGSLLLTRTTTEFAIASGCLMESANGAVIVVYAGIGESWQYLGNIGTSPEDPALRITGDEGESACSGFRAAVYPAGPTRLAAPHWFLILIGVVSSAIPWMRLQFGLRTLLIAITLVGVALGWIVYVMRS
jgi:hypothetical protein